MCGVSTPQGCVTTCHRRVVCPHSRGGPKCGKQVWARRALRPRCRWGSPAPPPPPRSQAPDSALPWKLLPCARASPWRPRLLTPVSAHSASGRPAWRSQETRGRGLPIPQERRRLAPGPGEPDLGGPASPSSHGWPGTRISPLPPPAPVTPPSPESQDQLWLVLRFLPIFPFEQVLSSVLREICVEKRETELHLRACARV